MKVTSELLNLADLYNISINKQIVNKFQFHLFPQLPVPKALTKQLDLFYEPDQHKQNNEENSTQVILLLNTYNR